MTEYINGVKTGGDPGEEHLVLLLENYNSIDQGTWAIATNSSYLRNCIFYNTTGAQNDKIILKAFLAEGTYSMRIVYIKAANVGYQEIDVGGTNWLSQDGYNGAAQYNQIATVTGKTVTTSGVKDIEIYSSQKNGSASAYGIRILEIGIWRTV